MHCGHFGPPHNLGLLHAFRRCLLSRIPCDPSQLTDVGGTGKDGERSCTIATICSSTPLLLLVGHQWWTEPAVWWSLDHHSLMACQIQGSNHCVVHVL